MRWAAAVVLGVVAGACGGSSPHVDSGGDGGTGGITTPGADAGPADAGPADGGVGQAADCIGIVPASTGASLTFDVPDSAGRTCAAATSDGKGIMAVEVHDAGVAPAPNDSVRWTEVGTNGAYQGSFVGPFALFPQPVGFAGYSSGWATLWDEGGGTANFTPVEQGARIAPAFGSGTLAIGTASTGVVVHRIDAGGNETGVLKSSIAGTPWAAAEDQGGAILVVVQSADGAAQGAWFDLARGTAGTPFSLGAASRDALARPLAAGGIAVRLDGRWVATVKPGDATLYAPPSWLREGTDFSLARAGKAYALTQPGSNLVDLVSTQGNACGPVTFRGVSEVSIGADGTVIGASGAGGCTKIFWRNALK